MPLAEVPPAGACLDCNITGTGAGRMSRPRVDWEWFIAGAVVAVAIVLIGGSW